MLFVNGTIRQKLPQFLIAALLTSISYGMAHARILQGEGVGEDINSAKNSALSTLANNIYVQVESNTSLYQDSSGANDYRLEIKSSSRVPLIGVNYQCESSAKSYHCVAELDTTTSAPAYKEEIRVLVNRINNDYKLLNFIEDDKKLDALFAIHTHYLQYEKLRSVTNVLTEGARGINEPAPSLKEVELLISKLEEAISSLKMAALFLARELPQTDIDVKPVTPAGSREATSFSSALLKETQKRLAVTNNPKAAKFILEGNYTENDSGIKVNYNLSDKQGNSVKSLIINLLPESYAQYKTKPLAADFDQLLHSKYASSGGFQTHIATNKGMRDLLFHKGETIELLIKANQPSYFYLAGHTKNLEMEQSYIVDLSEASGNRRFIGYIGTDDVNRWVSLGAFSVEPPFGIESMQLMASTEDLITHLPNYQYAPETGYYVISRNITEGVRKTRGLKKVNKQKKYIGIQSESVLMFTTEK